jgi:hypothetical protein
VVIGAALSFRGGRAPFPAWAVALTRDRRLHALRARLEDGVADVGHQLVQIGIGVVDDDPAVGVAGREREIASRRRWPRPLPASPLRDDGRCSRGHQLGDLAAAARDRRVDVDEDHHFGPHAAGRVVDDRANRGVGRWRICRASTSAVYRYRSVMTTSARVRPGITTSSAS